MSGLSRITDQTAILTLARVHGGTISAGRVGMLLFVFATEPGAVTFADSTGGMLIRGLERGAVHVAVQIVEGAA